MNEWGDKDREMEGWHHRGHPGQRGRMHGEPTFGIISISSLRAICVILWRRGPSYAFFLHTWFLQLTLLIILENYGRGMRMEHKRRGPPRNEPPPAEKQTLSPAQPAAAAVRPATAPVRSDAGAGAEVDDKPIPDDLSEISDDPDDILNREDVSFQKTGGLVESAPKVVAAEATNPNGPAYLKNSASSLRKL